MATPIARSGDIFIYTDASGRRTGKPVVGLLSAAHTGNGSPVVASGQTIRKADGSTVVLGAELGSRFTVNGNPVKNLHSRQGVVNGDLNAKYGVG